MPSLPTDSLAPAEFIVRRMFRTVDLADGMKFSAASETAQPLGGDDWFWTDDNAKILEFLSRPELWARFPEEVAGILHFVQAMCRGPFIFRRLSAPQLRPAEREGTRSSYRHSLLNIQCELQRGAVVAGLRFHDERNFDNLLLHGNRVEFTHQRKRHKLSVEKAIGDTSAELTGHILELRHASELRLPASDRGLRAGRITYLYRFDARSLLIEVEANFEIDAAIELEDVVLTIGHDQLSRWHYAAIDADTRTGDSCLFSAGKPGRHTIPLSGARYYVIRQAHSSGDALALHSQPREPARLSHVEVTGEVQGLLHHAVVCYRFPGSHRGATLRIAEDKLLTGGGLYDRVPDYAGFMKDAVAAKSSQQAAYDFSTSYDYGVVVNAFAKCFAICGRVPGQPHLAAQQPVLRELADRYLTHYLDVAVAGHRQGRNTVFSRELSFVLLAAATMHRATGDDVYLRQIAAYSEALLDLEVLYTDLGRETASGFRMRIDAQAIAHVDCHSASLLALVRAAPLVADDRIVAAIDRGLRAYCLDSSVTDKVRADGIGTLVIDSAGTRWSENAFWNFKIGLTLRLFGALRDSPDSRLRDVAARHGDRLDLLAAVARNQLERSMLLRDGAIEMCCAPRGTETNSETQPWVMLGLLGHPAD